MPNQGTGNSCFFQYQDVRLPDFFRHTRESRYPFFSTSYWIPAYAGMTKSESPEYKKWLAQQPASGTLPALPVLP